MKNPQPDIIYEDNHLLVVDKPGGLLSQGDDSGDVTIVEICKAYLKAKYDKPGNVYLGLVHRLDRPVSGVIVLARTSKAAGRLSAQFRDGRVGKIYLAVVEGAFRDERGELRHFMGAGQRSDGRTPISDSPFAGAREARLAYEVLETFDHRQLLSVHPISGRRHQIRAQLSAAGHPVVGDRKYGSKTGRSAGKIALHAWRLEFDHPTRGGSLEFVADPPGRAPWTETGPMAGRGPHPRRRG